MKVERIINIAPIQKEFPEKDRDVIYQEKEPKPKPRQKQRVEADGKEILADRYEPSQNFDPEGEPNTTDIVKLSRDVSGANDGWGVGFE